MDNRILSSREEMPRRSFFGAFMAVCSGLIGAILAIPVVRAALFPLRDAGSQDTWSDLGAVDKFADLKTPIAQPVNIERLDGWQLTRTEQVVYVVAGADQKPCVLSSTCPHLGCTVQWQAAKNEFVCPCHGGTYAPDGSRISGPPHRGMDAFPMRVQDGHLQIQYQNYRQLVATKDPVD